MDRYALAEGIIVDRVLMSAGGEERRWAAASGDGWHQGSGGLREGRSVVGSQLPSASARARYQGVRQGGSAAAYVVVRFHTVGHRSRTGAALNWSEGCK
jgi:hypothetical protein